ncbi:PAS domain S-box protein [Verrucomicrobiota bacterium sgz303538]
MKKAPKASILDYSEAEADARRVAELQELQILGTPPEEAFDDLTALAAHVCSTPVAIISFIDEERVWIKSRVGTEFTPPPKDIAFCTHALKQTDLLVVPDAVADERFADNPLVISAPYVRFYAGAPLITSGGTAIGALCVLDTVARQLTPDQELALRVLGRHVMTQLELRRSDTRRRAAEEALQRSHAELERCVEERTSELEKAREEAIAARRAAAEIVDRVSDGLISLDTNWHYTYVNEKAAELLGKRPGDILGKHIWTEFPEGIDQPFARAYGKAIAEQKTMTLEAYYEPWDRWFENRIYPSANGLSIFFQEITDRKRAEEKLMREKRLNDAFISSLPGCFYLIEKDGNFLRWNKRTEEVTGLTAAELATKTPREVIAPPDREAVRNGLTKAFTEGEATTEARILHKDGTETWHLCSGRRVEVDGKLCIVGLAVDISERKRAEELLHDAQARLQVAVRASGVGLWDWDLISDRAYVSPEWRAQFGFDEAEVVRPFSEWKGRLHPADREMAVKRLKAFLANSTPEYLSEVRVRQNDGSYRWIFARAQLIRNEQGQAVRMMGCHIDITERRQTEERLRQQREQLRALAKHMNSVREEEAGRIARELHDELGAALTGLKIDINRLGQRLEKDTVAALRKHVREILSSIDETIRSVRKLCLDLRPAVLDQLGLTAAVEWLVAEFQTRTGIACELQQPESVSIHETCAITIFRIFQELLTNVARHAKATRVSIGLRQEEDKVVLDVQDNGRGLPNDALTRHDRFGLLGIRERALAIGGIVEFHSTQNVGTRVVVCVPID